MMKKGYTGRPAPQMLSTSTTRKPLGGVVSPVAARTRKPSVMRASTPLNFLRGKR